MKLSESWLREWATPNVNTKELADKLSLSGLEVASVESVAKTFSNVCIGHVIEVEQHPNADRLSVCKVDVGKGDPLGIVCGAANVRLNLKVAAACIGANLGGDFKIKKSKLRGVESHGMLCSASELGLAEESAGILELADDAPIGMDVREYLSLDDNMIDIEITPNRGDCQSVMGVAREVSAIFSTSLMSHDFQAPEVSSPKQVKVNVTDKRCLQYIGQVIEGINPEAVTPLWMQEKIRRSGLRTINLIVDITNYVMLELGQPLHAFDLDLLNGAISVKTSKKGEKLKLLSEQEITLDDDTILISDDKNPLALAGILGGFDSGVTDQTTNIFLESALFEPTQIRKKAKQYNLTTDSSYRFERGVDPELQKLAISRACQLVIEIAGGKAGKLTEVVTKKIKPAVVTLRASRINKILGTNISNSEIESILCSLQMSVKSTSEGVWDVTVPTFRYDVSMERDLIEEVARLYGYDAIDAKIPHFSGKINKGLLSFNPLKSFRRTLLERDYSQAINYSFTSFDKQNLLASDGELLLLQNPISAQHAAMRVSLWPGLLTSLEYNQNRQQSRVRLFEDGVCFKQENGEIKHQNMIAGVVCGDIVDEQWGIKPRKADFYDVKADVEALLSIVGVRDKCTFEMGEHPLLHGGQSSIIKIGDQPVGRVGALHPKHEKEYGLVGPVILFEIMLDQLPNKNNKEFCEISKYPQVRRDLALLVPQEVSAAVIQEKFHQIEANFLKNVKIFDIYQGERIQNGFKSIGLKIIMWLNNRTLNDSEVESFVNNVVLEMKDKLKAKLRD